MTEDMYFGIGAYLGFVVLITLFIPTFYTAYVASVNMIKDIETDYTNSPNTKRDELFESWGWVCLDYDTGLCWISGLLWGFVTLLLWPVTLVGLFYYGCLLVLRMKFRLQKHMDNKAIHKGVE